MPMTPYIWFALIVTLGSGPLETVVAYRNAETPRPPLRRYLLYALMTFPYTVLKNVIQTISIRDELAGQREWIVSARQ